MKLLVCGSNDITPEYMFISNDKTYYFEEMLDELIEGIEATSGEEIKLITKGSNSGIDAMVNLYCNETGVELEEKNINRKLIEHDAEVLRDVQLANEADSGIFFYIKYQKFKGSELDTLCDMMEERGKPVYIFPMEKYS